MTLTDINIHPDFESVQLQITVTTNHSPEHKYIVHYTLQLPRVQLFALLLFHDRHKLQSAIASWYLHILLVVPCCPRFCHQNRFGHTNTQELNSLGFHPKILLVFQIFEDEKCRPHPYGQRIHLYITLIRYLKISSIPGFQDFCR